MSLLTLHVGDALEVLRTMQDESAQCCVTSPPYFNLRDFGCKGQIGLEKSPALFVAKLVAVFREVRRVLRSDGTCWVNLGDSYAANHGSGSVSPGDKQASNVGSLTDAVRNPKDYGLKNKDLIGIPWMVAFALRDDGWYLRSEIIWYKPNAMPESVTDRPAKAHEHLFLLSKSPRYFYDGDAIKEPVTGTAQPRGTGVNAKAKSPDGGDRTVGDGGHGSVHKVYSGNGVGFGHGSDGESRDRGRIKTPGVNSRIHQDRDPNHSSARKNRQNESFSAAVSGLVDVRNKRSVWSVATAPFKEAHFATFPPDLVRPCILAGSRPGDIVLDPFFGSGTTGMVSIELGRLAWGIELNPVYADLARKRCNVTPGLPL